MHLFTFCRQAACPRRTASIRPPADRAGDGRTTLNRPAGLKSKPESGRNKPSDHTINPSTQCRNKMKSSQAKTLKTHRSRCPHSWDRCSQPIGNPVPNGWESCSQQPGIPFPDTGTSRLTADAEDDLLRTPPFRQEEAVLFPKRCGVLRNGKRKRDCCTGNRKTAEEGNGRPMRPARICQTLLISCLLPIKKV